MTEYLARTFDSMVDSSHVANDWAVLLDWDEAICYALITAQVTGIKYRIHKSTLIKGAWFVYRTGESAARPGIEKKLSRKSTLDQGNH